MSAEAPTGPAVPEGSRTPWTAGPATVFAVLSLAAAILTAQLLHPFLAGSRRWMEGPRAPGSTGGGLGHDAMLTMLVLQAVIAGLVWWGAGWFGGERRRVLGLGSLPTPRMLLGGALGMAALLGPYNLAVYLLSPETFASDLGVFRDLARAPVVWLAALVLAGGAPVAEELLFRGFLLPALNRATPLFFGGLAAALILVQALAPLVLRPIAPLPFPLLGGNILAATVALLVMASFLDVYRRSRATAHRPTPALAAVVTSAGWTALHAYSLSGMIEVFLIGLYFAWLMGRHGNLWLPIVLHALYNGGQLTVLALWAA